MVDLNTTQVPVTFRAAIGRRSTAWWITAASCAFLCLTFTVPTPGQQPARQQDDDSLTYSPRTKTGPPGTISPDDLQTLGPLEDLIARSEFQEALPGLIRYVEARPDSARGHYDLGYLYFRTHKTGDSIRELSRSLQLNVDDGEAHKILGLDCSIVGRYDLAETELATAVKLEPNSPEIHYLLGRAYYTRGVYPLAQKEFETAIHLSPAYMKAYGNLGLVLEIQGHNDAAVENYLAAVRLNEEQKLDSPWPYQYLSAYYGRQREPDKQVEFAQKALLLDPKFDLAFFQMAKAYQNQNKWKECEEAVQKAIAINPGTADYFYVLSVALRRLGRTDESEVAIKKFQDLHAKEEAQADMVKKARSEGAQKTTTRPPDER